MSKYLLIDFGSTYTKVTAYDSSKDEIIAKAKSITTIDTSVMDGLNDAISKLDIKSFDGYKKLACSSAAGGLKMIAVGLVEKLTSEAAKRAALGAGARIIKTYSNILIQKDVDDIKSSDADIILLAGGIDGGNKEVVEKNAEILAKAGLDIPLIYAGNKVARDFVETTLKKANVEVYLTDNVMPSLAELNEIPAREEIRKVFMSNIIKSKGIDKSLEFVGSDIIPTPSAVLMAGEALSKGSNKEPGVGSLIIVDIGGATTDIHSLGKGSPTKPNVNIGGLEEPFAKRTVEGDLGMRYSAESLYHAIAEHEFKKHLGNEFDCDVQAECLKRYENITMVPKTKEEIWFDTGMARVAIDISLDRHAGHMKVSYSPFGEMHTQYGKDLTGCKLVIGTGGVIVHSEKHKEILSACEFKPNRPDILRPMKPEYLLDKSYILSAAGLLSQVDQDAAVRMMKKYLI